MFKTFVIPLFIISICFSMAAVALNMVAPCFTVEGIIAGVIKVMVWIVLAN